MYGDPFYYAYGIWSVLFSVLNTGAEVLFALFIGLLGVFLVFRGFRAPLRGLMVAGLGFLLWSISEMAAELTWFFTQQFSLRWTVMETFGVNFVSLGLIAIDALGLFVNAVCLAMVILGVAGAVRSVALAVPEPEPDPADAP